jgi:hypothetical protein
MNRFKMTAATLGLLSACFVSSLRADDSNKETRMTINGPLQVQDTLLAPGQYVFKLTEPDIAHSVVSIYNSDGTRLMGIIMGWSAYRTDAGDKNLFTISQPQGGQPAQLQTWFYPGDNFGVEFSVAKNATVAGHVMKSNGKGQDAGAPGDASSTHD